MKRIRGAQKAITPKASACGGRCCRGTVQHDRRRGIIPLLQPIETDYPQSGDIEVDSEKKTAILLITEEQTGKDNAVILHELIHLILWEYDNFLEENLPESKKGKYFDLLEKTVADLTNVLLQKDKI